MARAPIGTTAMVLLALGAAFGDCHASRAATRPAASREAIERDWMLQDYLRIELPAGSSERSRSGDRRISVGLSRGATMRCWNACRASPAIATAYVEERMLVRVLADLDRVPGDIRAAADQLCRRPHAWQRPALEAVLPAGV